MPDLHMSFFTPSDVLRLEQQTSRYLQMIRQSMAGLEDNEDRLEINFEPTATDAYVVKSASWSITGTGYARDVHRVFGGSSVIVVPSNMSFRDYLELLFLKVTNGLGASLIPDTRSLGLNIHHRVILYKSKG